MNELPVIGYPCLRIELWDRQGGKHCKSLEGIVLRKVALRYKKNDFGARSTVFRRRFVANEFRKC